MKTPRVADFYPDAKPVPSLGSPMDHLPAIQKQTHSQEPIQQSQEKRTLDRTYARTPVRRFRRRYPFEFFQDQLDWLHDHSLNEKQQGLPGSQSQMVRDALDMYIAKKNLEEK